MGAQYSHLIFQPPSPPSYDENLNGLVWIKQEGLKLASLYLELETKDGTTAKYTLLYIPGNTEDIGRTKSWLQTLQLTLKVNIITFDYPGFGLSEGEANEKNIYLSSSVVYKYLVTTKNVDPSCVIIMGKNLGTAGALNLFHENKKRTPTAAGLILLTTFTSLMAISTSKLKFGKGDMFENIKKVDKVFCPTLVAHGLKDEIIDIKLAKKLASKISTTWKVLELEEVGHTGIEFESDFLDTTIEFIDELRKLNDPNYHKPSFNTQVPAMYRLSPINQWLQDIHMEQYTEQFLSSGYFNLDHIANLDRLDLIGIGIENEDHITCILEAIPGRMGDKETKSTILSDFQFSEKDFSEIDIIGPCDEDSVSFWKVVEQHGIFSYNFEDIPQSWKKAISFSSTISIPYFQDKNEKLISKDFFGEVYEANWNGVTVLKHKLNHKKTNFKTFCKDAIILCQLKHPNVVNTIGACIQSQHPYCIIQEKLESDSLSSYLQKNADIPTAFRLKFALDIAYGLLFLHTRVPPVIHKDLTTRNIQLTADNTAKLAEFGYGIPPTFAFTAPEVFQRKPYSRGSDIYSLGLVFYEIITGSVPFSGNNGAEIAAKVAKEGFRPPFPSDTSAFWINLISQCWEKDPESRPSIEEVIDLLVDNAKSEGLDTSNYLVIPPQKLFDTSFLNGEVIVDVDLRQSLEDKSKPTTNQTSPQTHPSAMLLFDLKSMVNQEKYSDLVIEVGSDKTKFFGHKIILARNAQFEVLIDQSENNTISFPCIQACVMPYILEYLYTGNLSTLPENIFELISTTHELGLSQIVEICKEYIEDNGIPIPNCGEIKLGVNENIISPQNKKRLEIVRESLFNVENGIKNIEETLNNLNLKLESATVKKKRAK